jgi:transglutaminase-like putative cysteine protease
MRYAVLLTVLWCGAALAQDSEELGKPKPVEGPVRGKVLKEAWDAAFLGGGQVGYAHHLYQEVKIGERTYIEATSRMELILKRFGQPMELSFKLSNYETAAGRVRSFLVDQPLSNNQRILRRGVVEGKQLRHIVQVGNGPLEEKQLPWNDEVLGLYAQEQLFQRRTVDPNTQFEFRRFEPTFDVVLTTQVQVKDLETVTLLSGQRRKLLRVELKMQKVRNFTPPEETVWVDEQGEVLKRKMQMPGIGELVTYRTTKPKALARGVGPQLDIGLAQLVKVNQSVDRFNEAAEVTYHIRLKEVEQPDKAFATDDRQHVKLLADGTLEIRVTGLEQPSPQERKKQVPPPADYLKSNHFLKSDDAQVQSLTKRAVGKETDAWEKARLIERWVQSHMKHGNFSVAFATADEVARNLEGDCTEHAVLAAAMCRASGVPARTAVGLVHVPHKQCMSFHMWIEVWIGGKWFALDPTLGHGRVGACHLKVIDNHWNDEQSFTPLLPVVQLLGKLQVEMKDVKLREE